MVPLAALTASLLASIAPSSDTTTLVSQSVASGLGNADSDRSAVSSDGRYVVFQSAASNLDPIDSDAGLDIFRHDTWTGEIELVSIGRAGFNSGNGNSKNVSCSADGEIIAFDSEASNLVTGDSNGFSDVFVRDMRTGVTLRASVTATGAQSSSVSVSPRLSRDGRFVVFNSLAALAPNDGFMGDDVYRYDLVARELELVSIAADGTPSNNFSVEASITDDGQKVAFRSFGSTLVAGDTNGLEDVFVKDMVSEAVTLVSTAADGTQPDAAVGSPDISGNGEVVVFTSRAGNLVGQAVVQSWRAYAKYLGTGELEPLTVRPDGFLSISPVPEQRFIRTTADGKHAVFHSDASDLVFGDVNGRRDVFVRDLDGGLTELVSVTPAGVSSAAASQRPAISANGRYVAFGSRGSDLVPGVGGGLQQIFLRDRYGDGGLGTSFCALTLNSTGKPGRMTATGSSELALNDLTLSAVDLSQQTFGFFITSKTIAFLPATGGPLGRLCLGGAIGRFVGPGEVQSTGASGSISIRSDLTMMPSSVGFVPGAVGETWAFQAWSRESSMGQPTSIFTDAIGVTLR